MTVVVLNPISKETPIKKPKEKRISYDDLPRLGVDICMLTSGPNLKT